VQVNEASVGEPARAVAADAAADGSPGPTNRLDWLQPFTSRFVEGITSALEALDVEAVDRVVTTLSRARADGQVIFVAGNGGSAATASHWVNDLAKATRSAGLPYVRAISLTDSTPWMTALANDEGYERVFAGQLENMARAGDVLVVISASGNSPNLVRAVEFARANGVETIGLLGFDGGLLRTMVDHSVWIETPLGAYGLAENIHSVVCDLVTSCLAQQTSPYRGR
jgi:D-sedoheptulose 7-phosphate isomerase